MTRERFGTTSTPPARPDAPSAGGGILLVGPVAPPGSGPRAWFHAESGLEGLGLLTHGGLGETFDVLLAHTRLPDMSGVGFLERARALCPDTVRVLLLDGGDPVPDAEQLVRLGLDDAWPAADGAALDGRLAREARSLARTRALRRRLAEALERVALLEGRCAHLAGERGRLAGAFGRWLERHDGTAGLALDRWRRAYGEWLDLTAGRCPVHARAVPLAGLLPPGPEAAGMATGAARVRADPVLARRAFLLLVRGAAEFSRDPAPRLEPRRDGAALRIRAALPEDGGPEVLLDPFARLPGERLAGSSLDLVLARALLEVQGGELRLRSSGPELVLEARLPRLEPAGRPPL